MILDHQYLLIIDLEGTCSENFEEFPEEESEIIEVGAVMLNTVTMIIEDEFQALVKPIIHPNMTDFCVNLTSITQQELNHADGFTNVINEFIKWLDRYENWIFVSWGDYDRIQFQRDCTLNACDYPFCEHVDLKKEFSNILMLKKRFGLRLALNHIGVSFKGKAHRALNDAKNTANVARHLIGIMKEALLLKAMIKEQLGPLPYALSQDVDRLSKSCMCVFQNRNTAFEWLSEPLPVLNDRKPIQLCDYPEGLDQLIDLLKQIESRVYS